MSARREARSREVTMLTRGGGGVPAVIALGPCMEVWSDPKAKNDLYGMRAPLAEAISAHRRHSDARRRWLARAGITKATEAAEVTHPTGAPWSVEYMTGHGHTDRMVERFDRAGVTVDDIPALRVEAKRLLHRGVAET